MKNTSCYHSNPFSLNTHFVHPLKHLTSALTNCVSPDLWKSPTRYLMMWSDLWYSTFFWTDLNRLSLPVLSKELNFAEVFFGTRTSEIHNNVSIPSSSHATKLIRVSKLRRIIKRHQNHFGKKKKKVNLIAPTL